MQSLLLTAMVFFLNTTPGEIGIFENKTNTQRPRIIHNQRTKLSEILVLKPSKKDLAIVEKDHKQIIYAPIFEPSKTKIKPHKKEIDQ